MPLVVIDSLYRSFTQPFLTYIDTLEDDDPETVITVVLERPKPGIRSEPGCYPEAVIRKGVHDMAAPLHVTPPLESGDHLTRDEFHRRYLDHPEIRAELVEGVVYVSSPVSRQHAEPHSTAVIWVGTYRIRTPGLLTADNGTLLLPTGDEVQPDVCLYRPPPLGNVRYVERREGKEWVTYLEGVPDLVFEVAASSASYDLHSKKRSYERSGVPEYIVWQIYEGRLSWFRLRNGRYVEVEPDERGVIESTVFSGLRLAVSKLLAGDDAGVLDELTRG